MRSSNPLNTDKTNIKAAVPTAMPNTAIADITLITLVDFFPKTYLTANLDDTFKFLLLQQR